MGDSKIFTKDPTAVKDYTIPWSNWLAVGDTIRTSTWAVPTGITKVTDTNTTTSTTIWLSGGTAGTTYSVSNTIVTVGGRTEKQTLSFVIESQ